MKKKILLIAMIVVGVASLVSLNPFPAKSDKYVGQGGTCYESTMYFCRYCSGGALNKKQVTLCLDGISVE